jgi:amino acid adenylation domain-containing protein
MNNQATPLRNLAQSIQSSARQKIALALSLDHVTNDVAHDATNQVKDDTTVPVPSRSSCARRLCASHLVAAIAESSPDSIAVSEGSAQINYGELNARSNQLAAYLRAFGVGREVPVAICLDRSFDYAIAALAVWKAGGAYVPLDPQWPVERREFIIEDAGAPVLITRAPFGCKARYVVDVDANSHGIAREVAFPAVESKRENLAYIIYTLDSTGKPKGVEVTHGNLLNLIFWHRRVFGVTAADRASHLAGLGFDAAVWELWPYLTAGASIALADDTIRTSPDLLRDWIAASGITMAFVPTTLAEPMLTATWPQSCKLRFLLTGADTLHRYPSRDLPFTVVNNYGPPECTVVATSGAVRPPVSDRMLPPIGAAITNTQIYVLDESMRRVRNGEVGEIYIGGSNVARGYRNRRALTAEKFLPNPFSQATDARMFRTGDLGCMLPDGQIAFRGRVDGREKIRGHRIEPDEVTSVLLRHPRVASGAVVAIADQQGGKRLAAYVVVDQSTGEAGSRLESAELRDFLAHRLPEFMIPAVFVTVAQLPLDTNGKLDREALPAPSSGNLLGVAGFRAPQRPVEIQIAAILCELLRGARVGLDDNFLLLGDYSVLGAQLSLRVRERFGVDLTPWHLLRASTVASVAREIEGMVMAKLDSMSEEEAVRLLAQLEK